MFSQADTRWTCRPGEIFVHYVNKLLCMPLLFVSAYNSVLLACPLQTPNMLTAIPVLFIPVSMLYHNWDLQTLKRISHVERCHVVTQHCSVSINPKFLWPHRFCSASCACLRTDTFCLLCTCFPVIMPCASVLWLRLECFVNTDELQRPEGRPLHQSRIKALGLSL